MTDVKDRHKTRLLGWHPSSVQDEAWIRAQAASTDRSLSALLDEALALLVASHSGNHNGVSGNHKGAAREEQATVVTTPTPPRERKQASKPQHEQAPAVVAKDDQPRPCRHPTAAVDELGWCHECGADIS